MRNLIVVDTSVLISALIGSQGPSRAVLRRCLTRTYRPLISNALFLEYEAVSSRDEIRRQCPLRPVDIRDLLDAFYSICEWIPVYYLWRPNLPDENDNFLVELAIAGNGHYIVTNNVQDIKGSELAFPDIRVLRPEEFLRGE